MYRVDLGSTMEPCALPPMNVRLSQNTLVFGPSLCWVFGMEVELVRSP